MHIYTVRRCEVWELSSDRSFYPTEKALWMAMVDNQRYARQMIMPQIGQEGQQILSSSKVLIVGAGGTGSTVALYLAASGVPCDVLDFDLVELSNLHR